VQHERLRQERFLNEFNLLEKNEAYKLIRDCFGFRLGDRQRVLNMQKQMETDLTKTSEVFQANMRWLEQGFLNVEGRQED